jgi:hypothetical protein
MPVWMRHSLAALAVLIWCSAAAPQNPRQARPSVFPPEIVIERSFVDVVKIAPRLYTVEEENEKVRVLRAKLPGGVRVPMHDQRSGLLVALTDVHLRLRTPENKSRDLHVAAGETRWIWEESHSVENLGLHACEFLFVEPKG